MYEFLQLQTCLQMWLSNLHLFIPSNNTRYLVHLFNSVCILASLSYSIVYCFILVAPDTIMFICHYSEIVKRQFEFHDQTSFSCLAETLNGHKCWGRTFLSCWLQLSFHCFNSLSAWQTGALSDADNISISDYVKPRIAFIFLALFYSSMDSQLANAVLALYRTNNGSRATHKLCIEPQNNSGWKGLVRSPRPSWPTGEMTSRCSTQLPLLIDEWITSDRQPVTSRVP